MSVTTFKELVEKRRKWYEASNENGFEEGIRRLLTDLYPDRAHFIYELLQNAEDACATEVEFKLETNALLFRHNGSHLFDLQDIESITSIANSSKRDEGGSIGKFGIGFKAVFAYTLSPIIHSGNWHFKICHTVVPEETQEGNNHPFLKEDKTLFIFPFDNPGKKPPKAYDEIVDGLSHLMPETILFLKNIREICFSYDTHEFLVTKTKEGEHRVVLRALSDSNVEREIPYLLFEEIISDFVLEDEGGKKSAPLRIGVAYRLESHNNDGEVVVPVADHNVFVFFPAEKETSNLRFCIHAPFASTASRDSVRDTVDNRHLMDRIIALQEQTLVYLRDNGFLTTDFLGILPNSHDHLPEMYRGFHTSLIKLFNEKPFTPTQDGSHSPAQNLFHGTPVSINRIFDNKDLQILTADVDAKWVKNALNNSRQDLFLEDLDITEWDIEDIIDAFYETPESVRQILSNKKDQYLSEMYVLIEKWHNENYWFGLDKIKRMPIFRLVTGEMASASERLYRMPKDSTLKMNDDVKIVAHQLHEGRYEKEVCSLLDLMDIPQYSLDTIVKEFITSFWRNPSSITDQQKFHYLDLALQRMDQGTFLVTDIQKYPVETSSGKIVRLNQIFLDNPYLDTSLSFFEEPFAKINRYQLPSNYKNQLSKEALEIMINSAEKLGIWIRLHLVDSNLIDNPEWRHLYFGKGCGSRQSVHSESRDYDILGLDQIIKSIQPEQSRVIWDFLLHVPNEKLKAFYRNNSKDPGRSACAKYIYTLNNNAWIPIRTGEMKCPYDVIFEDIPESWTIPKDKYDCPGLKAIGFGRISRLKQEEMVRKDEEAQKVGFKDDHEMQQFKELRDLAHKRGIPIKQLFVMLEHSQSVKINPRESPKLPTRVASNPDERREKIKKEYRKAPSQDYKLSLRSLRSDHSGFKRQAQTYLREEYEMDDGVMCQLCRHPSSFRTRRGEGYFEATQIFTGMKKEMDVQHIALCPVCFAKFDEWVRRVPENSDILRKSIIDHVPCQGESSVEIPLPDSGAQSVRSPLSGKSLYFTGAHFADLWTVLTSEDEGEMNNCNEKGT